jgi:hypothetical protein
MSILTLLLFWGLYSDVIEHSGVIYQVNAFFELVFKMFNDDTLFIEHSETNADGKGL